MNKKIIATIGPASINKKTIQKMDHLGVDYFRINLSHTDEKSFEPLIEKIREWTDKKICPDTEGAQLRVGELKKNKMELIVNQEVNLFGNNVNANVNFNELILNIERPGEVLSVGDILNIDFNGAAVQVIRIINKINVLVRTLKGGIILPNKGIGVDREIYLPCFTKKDKKIISIANKLKLNSIFLSFCSSAADVIKLRSMFKENVEIISKIESSLGLKNLSGICKESNSILIDRGDLSREIQLEKIPKAQKYIIRHAKQHSIPVFVATNLMESMLENSQPTRAELNDISGALDSGANGLVLAAETAIGKYPIDSVRILSNIIHEHNKKLIINDYEQLLSFDSPLLNDPHGGKLIQQFSDSKKKEIENLYSFHIDKKSIIDVMNICEGTYSPLNRFMCVDEIKSVLETHKLRDGSIWSLPILLQTNSKHFEKIPLKEPITLRDKENNSIIAIMEIEKIEKLNQLKNKFVKWFDVEDENHPGLKDILSRGDLILSGKPFLINEYKNHLKSNYELTPKQTRSLFHSNGWHKIISFHSRDIPHMGHEYMQNEALKKIDGDCLLISPVTGIKKSGDFNSDIIIKAYNALIKSGVYFPYSAVIGSFNTYSRYCGLRETVFSAICRKNYGCSHFIIGCDHTGMGKYYKAEESKKFFDKLDIKLLSFEEIKFDNKKKCYIEVDISKKTNSYKEISTTILREELKKNLFKKNFLINNQVYKVISQLINKKDLFI